MIDGYGGPIGCDCNARSTTYGVASPYGVPGTALLLNRGYRGYGEVGGGGGWTAAFTAATFLFPPLWPIAAASLIGTASHAIVTKKERAARDADLAAAKDGIQDTVDAINAKIAEIRMQQAMDARAVSTRIGPPQLLTQRLLDQGAADQAAASSSDWIGPAIGGVVVTAVVGGALFMLLGGKKR